MAFHGPQPIDSHAMRVHRQTLREEAEARNARTPVERTRKYRRKNGSGTPEGEEKCKRSLVSSAENRQLSCSRLTH